MSFPVYLGKFRKTRAEIAATKTEFEKLIGVFNGLCIDVRNHCLIK